MYFVNNAITDLLDEMLLRQASDLVIRTGEKSRLLIQGNMFTSDMHLPMDSNEITEDFLALGIDITDSLNGYYRHIVDDGSSDVHRFRFAVSQDTSGKIFISVRYIATIEDIPTMKVMQ